MKFRIGTRAASSVMPPKVIAVPVSGNQVVDPYEPCVFDGGHNALGIPHSGCAGISGVDE